MKLSQLKSIVKDAVKEAIQEEMKDILLEAVRVPKATVQETVTQKSLPQADKVQLRENMMNVLGSMMPGADGTIKATTADVCHYKLMDLVIQLLLMVNYLKEM